MNYYYSNIYWHFTGSPKNIAWDRIFQPKDILSHGKTKTNTECLHILTSILDSATLLAKSKETIDKHIISESFCCVTDIPIQNLHEHKKYYGNVAIGFKHDKIHKQFNPVLYIPKEILPTKLLEGESYFPFLGLGGGIGSIFLSGKRRPKVAIDEEKLGSHLINHFKLTSFSNKPGETFYREREWRKIGDFNFALDDVAAIIVPTKLVPKVNAFLDASRKYDISILTWELLAKM
jgi:hypothetical protein